MLQSWKNLESTLDFPEIYTNKAQNNVKSSQTREETKMAA